MKSYFKRLALAVDQLVNTIADGDEDETISSRVGRGAVKGDRLALILEWVIDLFLGKGHCRRAIGQ